MNNNNKVIPIHELRDYVKNLGSHFEMFNVWIKQLDQGYMPAEVVQSLSTKPMIEFHSIVNKIVKDNNLISVNDKQDDEKMCNVIKHMAKMQTQLTAFNSGQQRIGAMLPEFKQDIIRAVGGTISEEFSQLLNQFASSTESIENYFSQLKNQIEESKEEVIKAIHDESAKSQKLITDLKNEVSAKDQQLKQQF